MMQNKKGSLAPNLTDNLTDNLTEPKQQKQNQVKLSIESLK